MVSGVINYHDVLAEIEKIRNPKRGMVGNIVLLAVSIMIFSSLGYFNRPFEDAVIIVLVLLIHELGHLAGMLLFKYKNVRMFFIPFFGAAVSGYKSGRDGFRDGIITLLGPLPGIVISLLLVLYAPGDSVILKQASLTMLFINAFNILPIFPLDGGRVLDTVLLRRNKYIQVAFKILAVLALVAVAYKTNDRILGFFGLIILITIPNDYRTSIIAEQLKPSIEGEIKAGDEDELFNEKALVIHDAILKKYPAIKKTRTVAQLMIDVWDKITFRSPSIPKSLLLFLVYIASIVLVLVTSAFMYQAKGNSFVLKVDRNGHKIMVEQVREKNKLLRETQVSEKLYHGIETDYSPVTGKVTVTGKWDMGKRDGQWKFYNDGGEMIRVKYFDKGTLLFSKEFVDGDWKTIKPKISDADQQESSDVDEAGGLEGPTSDNDR